MQSRHDQAQRGLFRKRMMIVPTSIVGPFCESMLRDCCGYLPPMITDQCVVMEAGEPPVSSLVESGRMR